MAEPLRAFSFFFNPSSRGYFNFDIHNMNSYQFYVFVFQAAQGIMSNFHQYPHPHAMFSLAIPVLLNFLALKYQNLDKSPFDTRPKTVYSAILSLLLYTCTYSSYGAAYDQQRLHFHRRPSPPPVPVAAGVFHRCTLFFGYMAQACLASLLFPDSASPAFYVLYVTVSVGDLLYLLYKWIRRRRFRGNRSQGRPNSTHGRHLLPL